MKATGIVRRIDDLGRVVIPKEIRRTMRIREGDTLEIYTSRAGEVIFKKYSLLGGIADFGSVDPQWLEELSTSPIFTDLSSRYRQALILSQIRDFLLCAALTAGGFLLARWLRRKYRTA